MSVPMSSSPKYALFDRVLELGSDLAARGRILDPDQSRGWSRLSLHLLDSLNRFVSSVETAPQNHPLPQVRTVLQLFLLNMMLLAAVIEHAEAQAHPDSALPPDSADMIAHVLVDVSLFTHDAYEAHRLGIPLGHALRDVARASVMMGPLEAAFIAAIMQGDHDAASEAQQLLRAFMDAAVAGHVLPPPGEIEEGQS